MAVPPSRPSHISPLVLYDFLLATTVLCLELSFLLSSPSIVEDGDWARFVVIEPTALEDRLRTCQASWDLRDPSKIPTAATRILTWMEEILICVISDKYPGREFLLSLPGYLGYETKVLTLDLNNQTCGRHKTKKNSTIQ